MQSLNLIWLTRLNLRAGKTELAQKNWLPPINMPFRVGLNFGWCFTKCELSDTSEIDLKEGNFNSNNVIFQILGKVTGWAKSSSDPMPQTAIIPFNSLGGRRR